MPKAYIALPAGQIHYRIEGAGPPLLLLHHTPRSLALYDPIIGDLARGRTVIAWDAPGFGESYVPTSPPSVEGYAVLAAAFMSEVGIDVFGVFGCMTGAAIAIELAAAHPERVSHLGLMGVPLFPSDAEHAAALAAVDRGRRVGVDGAEMLGQWNTVISSWHHEGRIRDDMPEQGRALVVAKGYVSELLRSGEYWEHGSRAAYRYDTDSRLASLVLPTLVIGFAGERDPSIPLAPHLRSDAAVAQKLPNCAYVELPGAYAILATVADHDRLIAAMDGFFPSRNAAAGGDMS
jgi:pimeloyl-ACP methyl ester carboxylesterase